MNALVEVSLADDAVYQEAVKRKERLEAQIRDLNEELAALNNLIEVHERRASESPGSRRIRAPKLRSGWPRRARNTLRPEQLAARAVQIIRENGRPMTRTEIAVELEAQGVPLAGVDKTKNLGTILWRFQDLLESVPKRGYWIKGEPLPPHR